MAVSTSRRTKFVLDEDRIPRAWYNIAADLPTPPPPPLHPGTHQPLGPDDLAPLFPMALILQEVSSEREIEIPEPVRDAYALYRPSPLHRAHRLEQALDTPAHIYYKYEGVSPAGSHKPNTAIAQAFYNKQEGTRRIATETGAGQWGSALAFAGVLFGIEVKQIELKDIAEPRRISGWRTKHNEKLVRGLRVAVGQSEVNRLHGCFHGFSRETLRVV